jgi:hypothetical protein
MGKKLPETFGHLELNGRSANCYCCI